MKILRMFGSGFGIIISRQKNQPNREPNTMKISKKQTQCKYSAIPDIKFDEQSLTSFGGLPIVQLLFSNLNLKERLRNCFRNQKNSGSYNIETIALVVILHLILGFRKLQDISYYNTDPLVLRTLGLNMVPSASTLSRYLANVSSESVTEYRALSKNIVLERLKKERLNRVTLDFDGSVISTGRYAEGTAVGYNKIKKGQRSYYPLYCSIAQTGQIFDVHHRPGNVHDSNGAEAFILDCIRSVKASLPKSTLELRMDSAFFSEEIVQSLVEEDVEFTISVPFARYTELKDLIEQRQRWRSMDDTTSFFQASWKPKSWENRAEFIFVRQLKKIQQKGPVQLDLFTPYDYEYDFSVVVSNKKIKPKKVLAFHHGRGSQEGLFAELKTQNQMDYVPTRNLNGNKIYLISTLISHNINREMQMIAHERKRGTTEKRKALWVFEKIDTFRKKILQRAGRITFPQGRITLSLNVNKSAEQDFEHYLASLS